MKRTPLKRKTALAARTPLKRATSLIAGSKPKKAGKVPKKTKTLAKWKKELDVVFSRYIRQRDEGQCFTCPKKDDPKFMQCGHFVPRQYLAVRFDEKNCNCQCYACNMLYNGQPSAYAIRLKAKYGDSIIEELESARLVTTKLDPIWYQEKIAHYQSLLNGTSGEK
jgi:Bacteriophage Lambda NinG protein